MKIGAGMTEGDFMKKVLVIGSNSFSGSDFIDLLLQKKRFKVIGVSRSKEKPAVFLPYKKRKLDNFTFAQIDLNTEFIKLSKLINKFKPQYIVNFAAQSEVAPSWEHPEHWFETNAVSVARLGNFLKDLKFLKKYVHISSPEVYGTCSGQVLETAALNPTTPYAASKAAGDLFLFTLVKNFNFPLVLIRSTNVYGAHQQLFKIIPRTIISIKLGKKIHLHGGGKAVKSYIHIRDVSKGELVLMENGKNGQIYHLSPVKGVKVIDVVKLICKKMKADFNNNVRTAPERLGQDKAYVIDSSKVRKSYLWQPEISLAQGIEEVKIWINENWSTIKNLPHEYIHKP